MKELTKNLSEIKKDIDLLDINIITCERYSVPLYGDIYYWLGRAEQKKESPTKLHELHQRMERARDNMLMNCWKELKKR